MTIDTVGMVVCIAYYPVLFLVHYLTNRYFNVGKKA